MRRYNFNMIEITLALAILSIGIASVLGLFASGLKSQNTSVAHNNLSDIAEYVISDIRRRALYDATVDGWGATTSYINGMGTSYPAKDDGDYKESDFTITDASKQLTVSTNQLMLYRQIITVEDKDGNKSYGSDFSAIVRIKKVTGITVSGANCTNGTAVTQEISAITGTVADATDNKYPGYVLPNAAAVLMVEISWPAQANYSDREKREYRVEIFNDRFDKFVTAVSGS